MKIKRGSVYTNFSKGVDGSVGLNFGNSGEEDCHDSCRMKKGPCYAMISEERYPDLAGKLMRHYMAGPIWVVNKGLAELTEELIPWARFSTHGTLPPKGSMPIGVWKVFTERARKLVIEWLKRGAFVHIPVEDWNKAQAYRAMFKGLDVIVRRTVQGTLKDVIRAKDPVAWVVGEPRRGYITKKEKMRNLAEAFAIAKRIRAAGKSCVVCGAVCGSTKCGKCLACAIEQVDVVLYAFHG